MKIENYDFDNAELVVRDGITYLHVPKTDGNYKEATKDYIESALELNGARHEIWEAMLAKYNELK